MKKYLYIGLGGFFGAISRYLIKSINLFNYSGNFPINTLLINVTGSFILALFLSAALDWLEISEEARLGFSTGFLGAYTTFSSMCKETVGLMNRGNLGTAFFYLTASIMLGLAAAYLGYKAYKGIYKIAGKAD